MDFVEDLGGTSHATSYPSWKTQNTNVPYHSTDKAVAVPDRADNSGRGRGSMLCPEQKSTQVMKVIASKFSQPGNNVLDTRNGCFETVKACLQWVKYQNKSLAELLEESLLRP